MTIKPFTQKYRIRNPFKSDEEITQEVLVSSELQYDYSDSPWVAIDTEFLSLNLAYSKLCLIQIASPDPEQEQRQRVELVWVWPHGLADSSEAKASKSALAKLLGRKDLEILMHVSTADLPRIERYAGATFTGKLFDTKVAGKLLMVATDDHSMANLITTLIDPKFTKDRGQTSSQWDTEPSGWDEKTVQYAMNDVIFLQPLKLALEKVASRRGTTELLVETMQIMPAVCHLYTAGFSENVLGY